MTVEDDNSSCVPITVILSVVCPGEVMDHQVRWAVVPDSLKTLTILPRRGHSSLLLSPRLTQVGGNFCLFFFQAEIVLLEYIQPEDDVVQQQQ